MSILFPVAVVSGIGCGAGIVLSVASKLMAVPVDERYIAIRNELPGANCGACGFASCDSYAEALNLKPELPNNLCVPGGNDAAAAISKLLGEAFEEVEPMVAVVRCQGNNSNATEKMDYRGPQTCADSKRFYGGANSCSYGCIGLGDCKAVCAYDAICVDNGLAYINKDNCVGCGMCAKACPNGIIAVLPVKSSVVVSCMSKDKGAVARKNCKMACIGCMKCQRVCPNGAVKIENNLAVINPELCTSCGACVAGCPTKAIVGQIPQGDL